MHKISFLTRKISRPPLFIFIIFSPFFPAWVKAQDSTKQKSDSIKQLMDNTQRSIDEAAYIIDSAKQVMKLAKQQMDSLQQLQDSLQEQIAIAATGVSKTLYGKASFYADKFNGRKTASGEIFSQKKLTCACNKLPLGTWVRVTNISNGKSVVVKVNDRLHPRMKRIVDLTKAAANKLDFISSGLTKVKVEVLVKKNSKQMSFLQQGQLYYCLSDLED